MKHVFAARRAPILWAGLLGVSWAACADTAQTHAISQTERLSAWFERHPSAQPPGDIASWAWHAASERGGQAVLQRELAEVLAPSHSALAGFVRSLPVTGRVALPLVDGRWLQTNPSADPILREGDTLVRHARPADVAVLLPTGHVCRVAHQPAASWLAYVRACDPSVAPALSWLIQPDGQVVTADALKRYTAQPVLAPGGWLWVPPGDGAIAPAVSNRLAQFLATQGPADPAYPWTLRDRRIAAEPGLPDAPLPTSVNDWGTVGLLQTPTARMEPAGTAGLMFGRVLPYAHLKARLQPFDWLSVSFGYVSASDRLYGAADDEGDRSYVDKSADVKLRLWREAAWRPQVVVGLRDLIGTGLFASEYVVASKAFGNLDLSLGLAWGYLGSRGQFRNPLGLVSSRFDERPVIHSESGGTLNSKGYFRGRTALFGGIQYQLPSHPSWLLKLEYDGNDYRSPTDRGNIQAASPWNVGVVYRARSWLDLTVGFERGNQIMFGFSLHERMNRLDMIKFLDPPRVPVRPVGVASGQAHSVSDTVAELERQAGAAVKRMHGGDVRWTLVLDGADRGDQRPLVDKVVAVAHRDAPATVQTIRVALEERGVPVAEVAVDRTRWARERTEFLRPSERQTDRVTRPVAAGDPARQPGNLYDRDAAGLWQRGRAGLGLNYTQSLGGPDGLLFSLGAVAQGEYRLRDDLWATGVLQLRLLDNYDKFDYTAPSNLPRVRTFIREYQTDRRVTVPVAQVTHFGEAGQNHFYLAYGGLLESMYAGAGVEYLYRPVGSRWAVGVDVNRVQQREFSQGLGLRDYKVTTGHTTLYWDTGFEDVLLRLSAGRYLAGDVGITVDASRVFANGVRFGAYATKTDVSAAQFGEGSFDKGIYVSIPFDVMLPRTGGGAATITYAPLIRDGGARLSRRFTLYDLTRSRDPRADSAASSWQP
ncbi:YjbH domain-containing protein [uncultured Aquabacterium sp.]|uniref:YjbH domain-containing protein n=1 Tax=uncultured Aquabacterium sp. TaxID=158753 RepID=UPI002605D345|nr:YjbH domain-containing protein [uncultured Aquabacterium sp.]